MADDQVIQYKQMMENHKASLAELEKMLNQMDVGAITERNKALTIANQTVENEMAVLKTGYKQLQSDYQAIKLALSAQIMSEKTAYIVGSKNRIQMLFQGAQTSATNHLQQVEKEMLDYIKVYEEKTKSLTEELGNKYRQELTEIKERLKPDYVAAQQRFASGSSQISQKIEDAYKGEALKEITPELLTETVTRKAFEFKLGLNVLNKVGVVLILIAVVMAGQYTYNTFFGDYAKGITFYLIGAALLGVGEFFNRKKYTALAMSLIGGGIGVLYSATFISTFYLNILTLIPALLISAGIAGLSIVLASIYKSQVLGALSLVGGYLPVFAYVVVESIDALPILGAIAYLMILNAVILALSVKNRWHVVVLIGFVFNLLCVDTLVLLLDNTPQGIAVALVNFLTYLLIILYRLVKRSEKISIIDVGILSFNTLGHVGIIYTLLNANGPSLFNGLIALAFGALYIGLGIWLKKIGTQPVLTNLFFMIAGLFSILVIPLQLDVQWWFMGWLLEAILFIAWGLRENIQASRLCGWILFALSYLTFYLSTSELFSLDRDFPTLVDAKHLSLVLAAMTIVWLYRGIIGIDDGEKGKMVRGFRFITLTYLMMFLTIEGVLALGWLAPSVSLVEMVSVLLVVVVGTLKIGKFREWHKWIHLSNYRLFAYVFVALCVLNVNFVNQEPNGVRWLLEIFQIIAQNFFAAYTINLILKSPSLNLSITRTTRSYVVSIYVLFAYYLNFILRVVSEYDNLLLNTSLILFSIAYIVIGFKNKDDALRRVGLVIAFVATGKLLLWDSIQLPLGQKIISYFAFGISLIVISYVYQRINAKLIGVEKSEQSEKSEQIEKSEKSEVPDA